MGTNWSSHEYQGRTRTARRNYRCDACGGLIFKGERYENTYGGIGHEHLDACPDAKEERERRGCPA